MEEVWWATPAADKRSRGFLHRQVPSKAANRLRGSKVPSLCPGHAINSIPAMLSCGGVLSRRRGSARSHCCGCSRHSVHSALWYSLYKLESASAGALPAHLSSGVLLSCVHARV
jgi:hypothetical protein